MTKAADTGGTVPTASVVAEGQFCDYKPHFSPTNAAKAIPANMMMTSGQSVGSRSSLMQAIIDIGAILAGVALISLFTIAVAVAIAIPLFVNLKFLTARLPPRGS